MLHVYGLSSLHLNLLLEINTYCVFYPKNTGSVFNNSNEVYYSVAQKDQRRRTRDRCRAAVQRKRLRRGSAKEHIYAMTLVCHVIPTDASDKTQVGRLRMEAY
jgi:hypothetical protein